MQQIWTVLRHDCPNHPGLGLNQDAFTAAERKPTDPYMWVECTDPAEIATTCAASAFLFTAACQLDFPFIFLGFHGLFTAST